MSRNLFRRAPRRPWSIQLWQREGLLIVRHGAKSHVIIGNVYPEMLRERKEIPNNGRVGGSARSRTRLLQGTGQQHHGRRGCSNKAGGIPTVCSCPVLVFACVAVQAACVLSFQVYSCTFITFMYRASQQPPINSIFGLKNLGLV